MIWFAIIISLILRVLSKPLDPVNVGVGVFSVFFVYYLSFFIFKSKNKWLSYMVALLISTSPLYVLLPKYIFSGSIWILPLLLVGVPALYLAVTFILSKLNDKIFPPILVFVVFLQIAFSLGLLL